MKDRRHVHWGALGVALVPLSLIAAELDLPKLVAIATAVIGIVVALFAFGLPQRAAHWISTELGDYIQRALDDRRTYEARRLCVAAANTLHSLLATSLHGATSWTRLSRQRERQVLAEYEQVYRATVVHAVEAGIDAGASDAGTLALATNSRGIADLHALHAGLLRMVVELSQRSGPASEAVAFGGDRV